MFVLNKKTFLDSLKTEEWCEFPHLTGDERFLTDFNEVNGIINKEVKERSGESNGIVQEEIVLRIYSPSVINLTVIDLPGIVRVSSTHLFLLTFHLKISLT